MRAIPNIEGNLSLLDEIYTMFLDLGIEVIDVKDSLIWKKEPEEGEVVETAKVKKVAEYKTSELSEIANDSIRMYLCEIGKVKLFDG